MDNGQWQEGLDNIEHVATKYFSSLFISSQQGEMMKLLSSVTPFGHKCNEPAPS